jgi:hypothetical protein
VRRTAERGGREGLHRDSVSILYYNISTNCIACEFTRTNLSAIAFSAVTGQIVSEARSIVVYGNGGIAGTVSNASFVWASAQMWGQYAGVSGYTSINASDGQSVHQLGVNAAWSMAGSQGTDAEGRTLVLISQQQGLMGSFVLSLIGFSSQL